MFYFPSFIHSRFVLFMIDIFATKLILKMFSRTLNLKRSIGITVNLEIADKAFCVFINRFSINEVKFDVILNQKCRMQKQQKKRNCPGGQWVWVKENINMNCECNIRNYLSRIINKNCHKYHFRCPIKLVFISFVWVNARREKNPL